MGDLRPRFPLFGGWKTHYVIGYNVPSYEYLYYSGDKHVLNMRLVDHIFDDMLVEETEVKVILPEGITNIELNTPYSMTRRDDDKQDFQIGFTYPHRSMVMEPLLLVSAFFLLYLVTIIYVRLDFSIIRDESAESKMKVQ